MDNYDSFEVVLGLQGPRGLKGDKGDAGYIAFEIEGNDLIITENISEEITLTIVNGYLYMEVN